MFNSSQKLFQISYIALKRQRWLMRWSSSLVDECVITVKSVMILTHRFLIVWYQLIKVNFRSEDDYSIALHNNCHNKMGCWLKCIVCCGENGGHDYDFVANLENASWENPNSIYHGLYAYIIIKEWYQSFDTNICLVVNVLTIQTFIVKKSRSKQLS